MRTLQRAGAGLLALTLAAGIAACGSDDDKEATTATTGAAGDGDNAAFCDALIDFNAAVFQVDIHEGSTKDEIESQGKEIAPLFATVAEEAPDELADAADELNTSIQALTEGDATAFNDDATFEQYMGLVDGAIESCDMETIDVTGVDYAYEGAPDTVEAGTTAFKFTNAAEAEDHMMGIIKKKDGVDLSWDELLALPEDEAETKTEFKGEAYAPAGESGSALVELDPGSYAMICFIPVGGGEDGPPHFSQGMIHEFTVE